MIEQLATLKYDLFGASWVAVYDPNPVVIGYGETPELAVDNLRLQLNKHDLWVGMKAETE